MARLRLTINGITGERVIDDAKATAIANLIFDNAVAPNWPADVPLPSTPQEKLQAVVDHIAVEVREIARGYRRRALRIEQAAATDAAMAEIDVTP